MIQDYYAVLDVNRNADKQDLKQAYYRQVKMHPPETDPAGFQKLREAYAFLCDDAKRAGYDKRLELPDAVRQTVLQADDLLQNDRYKDAIDLLKKAEVKYPASKEIGLLLGQAYLLNVNYNKAIAQYGRMTEMYPEYQDARLCLAYAYHRRNFNAKAAEQYEAALEIDKNNPNAWRAYIGFLHAMQSPQYFRIFETAVSINPDMFKDSFIIYGNVSLLLGHGVWGVPANTRKGLQYLSQYAKYFLPAAHFDDSVFKATLSLIEVYYEEDMAEEILLKLYRKLETSGSQSARFSKEMNRYKEDMDFRDFYWNSGYDKAVINLTAALLDSKEFGNAEDKIFCAKMVLCMDPPLYRKDIRALQKDYPAYFELDPEFYLDLLNPKKEQRMIEEYVKKGGKLRKKIPDDIIKNFMDDDGFIDMPMAGGTPYRREERKIGRNEPCPCGSGKKYKHCCGKGA